MLQEIKKIDKIEIVNDVILIREVVIILKDDIEIASSFHRSSITKNDNRNNLDLKIKKIADALWGDEKETVEQVNTEVLTPVPEQQDVSGAL